MSIFDILNPKKEVDHLDEMAQMMTDNYVREDNRKGYCTTAELFRGTDFEDRYKNDHSEVRFKKFKNEG